MLIAEFTLGDALLTVLEVFFLVVWFWILITIIGDLFRDHEMSGGAKALWILLLVVVPLFGALIYLVARGQGMRDRAVKEQVEVKRHMDAYIRETAGSSPVDELHKLTELKEKGAISDSEFEQAKAKLLA